MSLVKEFLENEKQIDLLREQRDEIEKSTHKEVYRIKYQVYDAKIKALMDERDKKIGALVFEADGRKAEISRAIDERLTVIHKVERILDYLKLREKDLTILDEDVKSYHDRHIEPLGTIFKDTFLQIRLFIIENDKPKNKYSLVAIGRCSFDRELVGLPYSYGTPCYVSDWHTLEDVLKDAPTIGQLKQYWREHEVKLLPKLLGNYWEIANEYLETTQKYKINDFQQLLAWTCGCGHFYTKHEERQISRHTEEWKCPECGDPMQKVS